MENNDLLYKDWIVEWLKEKEYYIKESSFANYSNYIYTQIIPVLGDYKMIDINHKVIQDYILYLYKDGKIGKEGGLADKTIRDIVLIIKSSLRKAIDEEVIKNFNLKFHYPKHDRIERIYVLTKNEQNKLIDYIINNLNHRNIGILIALFSGIRVGELCALKWKDIDFRRGIIKINSNVIRVYTKTSRYTSIPKTVITTPKTKNAVREIPINRYFLEILRSLKTKDNYFIISGKEEPTEPRTYRKYYDRVLEKAKVKHINFHSLRHTFATNCISLGVDYKTVSELLGHANVNITLNLYVHPRLSQKRKCINLICKSLQEKTEYLQF